MASSNVSPWEWQPLSFGQKSMIAAVGFFFQKNGIVCNFSCYSSVIDFYRLEECYVHQVGMHQSNLRCFFLIPSRPSPATRPWAENLHHSKSPLHLPIQPAQTAPGDWRTHPLRTQCRCLLRLHRSCFFGILRKKFIKPLQVADELFHVSDTQATFDFHSQNVAPIHHQYINFQGFFPGGVAPYPLDST